MPEMQALEQDMTISTEEALLRVTAGVDGIWRITVEIGRLLAKRNIDATNILSRMTNFLQRAEILRNAAEDHPNTASDVLARLALIKAEMRTAVMSAHQHPTPKPVEVAAPVETAEKPAPIPESPRLWTLDLSESAVGNKVSYGEQLAHALEPYLKTLNPAVRHAFSQALAWGMHHQTSLSEVFRRMDPRGKGAAMRSVQDVGSFAGTAEMADAYHTIGSEEEQRIARPHVAALSTLLEPMTIQQAAALMPRLTPDTIQFLSAFLWQVQRRKADTIPDKSALPSLIAPEPDIVLKPAERTLLSTLCKAHPELLAWLLDELAPVRHHIARTKGPALASFETHPRSIGLSNALSMLLRIFNHDEVWQVLGQIVQDPHLMAATMSDPRCLTVFKYWKGGVTPGKLRSVFHSSQIIQDAAVAKTRGQRGHQKPESEVRRQALDAFYLSLEHATSTLFNKIHDTITAQSGMERLHREQTRKIVRDLMQEFQSDALISDLTTGAAAHKVPDEKELKTAMQQLWPSLDAALQALPPQRHIITGAHKPLGGTTAVTPVHVPAHHTRVPRITTAAAARV